MKKILVQAVKSLSWEGYQQFVNNMLTHAPLLVAQGYLVHLSYAGKNKSSALFLLFLICGLFFATLSIGNIQTMKERIKKSLADTPDKNVQRVAYGIVLLIFLAFLFVVIVLTAMALAQFFAPGV